MHGMPKEVRMHAHSAEQAQLCTSTAPQQQACAEQQRGSCSLQRLWMPCMHSRKELC